MDATPEFEIGNKRSLVRVGSTDSINLAFGNSQQLQMKKSASTRNAIKMMFGSNKDLSAINRKTSSDNVAGDTDKDFL